MLPRTGNGTSCIPNVRAMQDTTQRCHSRSHGAYGGGMSGGADGSYSPGRSPCTAGRGSLGVIPRDLKKVRSWPGISAIVSAAMRGPVLCSWGKEEGIAERRLSVRGGVLFVEVDEVHPREREVGVSQVPGTSCLVGSSFCFAHPSLSCLHPTAHGG